jgi:18S rRNA (guanine1575-N7)-methyltransferase
VHNRQPKKQQQTKLYPSPKKPSIRKDICIYIMSRPELTGHASNFYNEREARKYDSSSRMISVQREITIRAMELLKLNDFHSTYHRPAYVLDIGCGSGLSGQVLEEYGHIWVGCDISRDMLLVAQERMQQQAKDKEHQKNKMYDNDDDDADDDDDYDDEAQPESMGDLLHHDMGTGLPFRPATFDACVSISALQWLCYSNTKEQNPKQRLVRFFSSLYSVLKRNGRAVLQFYPETAEQAVLISETATQCGFTGGIVVDYPNSAKAKKHYLVLSFDRSNAQKKGAIDAAAIVQQQQSTRHVSVASTIHTNNRKEKVIRKGKHGSKTKEWILHKKETERNRGKAVRPDTKYTGRKRPTKF